MQTSWRDVSGLIQWILKMLSDHPVWVARLREEPACLEQEAEGQAKGLATRVVMETLRLEQSDYLMRRALEEIKVGDFVILKGRLLRICVRESHRSAEVFADPERFNPDRFLTCSPPRSEYSPFGASRVSCLGEHFTIMMGRIFASEIARGFDWKVIEDGPREYDGFHWKPSSRLRLCLTPRL
jgi:cytochrome P450